MFRITKSRTAEPIREVVKSKLLRRALKKQVRNK